MTGGKGVKRERTAESRAAHPHGDGRGHFSQPENERGLAHDSADRVHFMRSPFAILEARQASSAPASKEKNIILFQ